MKEDLQIQIDLDSRVETSSTKMGDYLVSPLLLTLSETRTTQLSIETTTQFLLVISQERDKVNTVLPL